MIFLKDTVFLFFCLFVFLFSHLIPRSKKIILFSAWSGKKYSDHPKAIFEEMLNNKDLNVYWVCKDKKIFLKLMGNSIPSIYAYSIKGILLQLRACAVVYSHQVNGEFCSCLISSSVKRIQCWHGIPMKKIDEDNSLDRYYLVKKYLKKYIFRHLYNKCDLVFASSKWEASVYSRAFDTSADNIALIGSPRNDALHWERKKQRVNQSKFNAIYMPTFRGEGNEEYSILKEVINKFEDFEGFFIKNNISITIRLHPVQKISIKDREKIKSIRCLVLDEGNNDIYDYLHEFDVLITDFSSIYFDYLLLERPIIMAPLDYEGYLSSERQLYFEYDELCMMEPCFSWELAMKQLVKAFENKVEIEKIINIKNKFHCIDDGFAARRAVDKIIKLI